MRLGSSPPAPEASRGGGEKVRTRDHLANARTFLRGPVGADLILTP